MLNSIRSKNGDILEAIRTDRELKKETEAKLADALAAFVKVFS